MGNFETAKYYISRALSLNKNSKIIIENYKIMHDELESSLVWSYNTVHSTSIGIGCIIIGNSFLS